jgi:hypothetical protein
LWLKICLGLAIFVPSFALIIAARMREFLLFFFSLLSICINSITCNQAICHSINAQYNFAPIPPAPNNQLSLCKEYSSSTCCTAAHTQEIMKQIYPYFDPHNEINDSCKQLTAAIYCSICSPSLGTGLTQGICENSCNSWYNSCSNVLFNEEMQPCNHNSLICSPLHNIVKNGNQFCSIMGFNPLPDSNNHYDDNSIIPTTTTAQFKSELDSLIATSRSNPHFSFSMQQCFDPSNHPSLSNPIKPNYKRAQDVKKKNNHSADDSIPSQFIRSINRIFRRALRQLNNNYYYQSIAVAIVILIFASLFLYLKQFLLNRNSRSERNEESIRLLRANLLEQLAKENNNDSAAFQ